MEKQSVKELGQLIRMIRRTGKSFPKRLWGFSGMVFVRLLFCLSLFLPLLAADALCEENWFDAGLGYIRQKRCKDAIKAFDRAVEILPHDFEAFNNRGVAWFCRRNYPAAAADFSRAIELNGSFAEAHVNRAVVWFHMKVFEQALLDAAAAAAIDPFFFEAYMVRAASFEKTKKYSEAITCYKEALKIKALPPEKLKDPELARHRYQNALVLRLSNKKVLSFGIARRIEELERLVKARPGPLPRKAPRHARANPMPFTIHTGSFKVMANAMREVARFKKSGEISHMAPVHIPEKGRFYRVYTGCFEDREAAGSARRKILHKGAGYARIMFLPYAIALPRQSSSVPGYTPYKIPGPREDRILIGAFPNQEEARKEAERLKSMGLDPEIVLRGP